MWKLCTKSSSLEIKWVFLEFAQILTQQYPAYILDTLFGADQALEHPDGFTTTHSRLSFSMQTVGQETGVCADSLLHVTLCWAEGGTT